MSLIPSRRAADSIALLAKSRSLLDVDRFEVGDAFAVEVDGGSAGKASAISRSGDGSSMKAKTGQSFYT